MKPSVIITGGSGFVGTNLVEHFHRREWKVLNLDVCPPRNPEHKRFWTAADLLDPTALRSIFARFRPSHVLHFAARTDLRETSNISGYAANIEGVQNIIDAVKCTGGIERVLFASSQLVCRIGYQPRHERDYCPSTLYGESKVRTEQTILAAPDMGASWVIVRPTSLWGPWFDVPYRDFFRAISRGLYIHPGGIKTRKQWGFVLNAVHEAERLLLAPAPQVHGRTFYMADYAPVLLRDFADMVQREMRVRPVRTVPFCFLQAAAKTGDLLRWMGWKNPPLTSFRLHNIVTDEVQNLADVEAVVGPLPYSVEAGIRETVAWMARHESPARS